MLTACGIACCLSQDYFCEEMKNTTSDVLNLSSHFFLRGKIRLLKDILQTPRNVSGKKQKMFRDT